MNKIINFLKKRRVILALIILFLTAGGFFIFNSGKKKVKYQTAKVTRGQIISSVSVSGSMLSSNIVNVTTQASGIVKKIYVTDGEKVEVGQTLMEIDLDLAGQQKNAAAWSSYLSAKNNLESAKAALYTLQSDMFSKWNAFKKFYESDTYKDPNSPNRNLPEFYIAQDDWLAAEAKYKNQQVVISQAQAALNNAWVTYQQSSSIITAPIAGIISGLLVAEGVTLSEVTTTAGTTQSQKVAVIKNEANPLGIFNLSEVDVSKVKTNQKATVTLDSLPGKTFTGKVKSIDRTGTVNSGVTNYPVIIQLDTSVPEILPNMAATANIILDSKDNVLLVPSAAVQNIQGESQVRVLKNGKVQSLTVQTGLASDTQTEITSGLSEGDEVIIGTIETITQRSSTSPFGSFGGGMMRIRRD